MHSFDSLRGTGLPESLVRKHASQAGSGLLLSWDWSLNTVEVPNLIRVLEPFENWVKSLDVQMYMHKILIVPSGALEVYTALNLGKQGPLSY